MKEFPMAPESSSVTELIRLLVGRVQADLLVRSEERFSNDKNTMIASHLRRVLRHQLDGDLQFPLAFGTFRIDHVPGLLEHFAAETPEGILFFCGADSGFIFWLSSGNMVQAIGDGMTGKRALAAACRLRNGIYCYVPEPVPAEFAAESNGRRGITCLLLDIFRELDEERRHGEDSGDHLSLHGSSDNPDGENRLNSLPEAELGIFLRYVDELRENHLMLRRAELDAWYYGESDTSIRRYRAHEQRSLGKFLSWLNSVGLQSLIDDLRDLPSIASKCDYLGNLLLKSSNNFNGRKNGTSMEDSSVNWELLEDAE